LTSYLKWILRLCVGAVLVYLLLFKHELAFKNVFAHLAELPVAYIIAALALYNCGQLMNAYRWSRLSTLGGKPATFADTWPVFYSGMFFNICLPTSIGGDVMRVVGLSRKTGSKSAALASVFMDRNIGLGGLLLVGFISSLLVVTSVEASFRGVTHVLPLWPLFLFLIVGYAGLNTALFSDRFCNFVTYVIKALRLKFISERIEKMHNSLQAFRKPLPRFGEAFLISFVYQCIETSVVAVLAVGMGIHTSVFVYSAMVPFQAVAALLPITFSGVGVRDAIFVAVLKGQLGDSDSVKTVAFALAFAYFGVVVMSSLFGGVVYLLGGVTRPSAAETEALSNPAVTGGQ